MSVICQNFVQNAWKKDLCSNCFKSVGDHDVSESEMIEATQNTNQNENLSIRYVSSNNGTSTPHTTWKSLISERNSKNSQPFNLETGFQGRLLTINKASNGVEKGKTSNGYTSDSQMSSSDVEVKGTNGHAPKKTSEVVQHFKKNPQPANGYLNGKNCQRNINTKLVNGAKLKETKRAAFANGRLKDLTHSSDELSSSELQPRLVKSKSVDSLSSPLHGILKKAASQQSRRGSNVGFKDEEPLVIGYGGRDFSPEELQWEMNTSDGESTTSDGLDDTEDDKAFYKMTQLNTEFNSDNANLLQANGKFSSVASPSTQSCKNACKSSPVNNKSKCNGADSDATERSKTKNVVVKENGGHANKEEESNPQTKDIKTASKGVELANRGNDFAKVSIKDDKIHPVPAKVGEGDKNRPELLVNDPLPPSSAIPTQNTAEAGREISAMDSAEGTENNDDTLPDENNEWQGSDGIAGEILQAINTSLANRHKMNEDQQKIHEQLDTKSSNDVPETPPEGSDGHLECMEPRASFLHGITCSDRVVNPHAIYGPASDLFVSRSDSSSSSSSDEPGRSEKAHSINVIVNGKDPHARNSLRNGSVTESENEDVRSQCSYRSMQENKPSVMFKTKPRLPVKPFKQPARPPLKQTQSLDVLHSKSENLDNFSYYSVSNASMYSESPKSITLVDHYAESNIYHEVDNEQMKQESEQYEKAVPIESKLAALAIELEQARHCNGNTKRQAPAPPKIPDPPMEDPPNSAGRTSPIVGDPQLGFSSFRGEAMAFSSSSSTTSSSSQDTEMGYASWNLHGEDHRKQSKSKSSFLLAQYSKCKSLAMGYAEDSARSRKKFSLKKLLKMKKESENSAAFDPNSPNPKAWKYSDHFDRPRAKLEIIHPMDLENKSLTVNPGFDSLHSVSMSSFSASADDVSLRNSVSSDYGSFYSDTMSPMQDGKSEVNYEFIQSRLPTSEPEDSEERNASSNSPTPSRTSSVSQASTLTSGSSKNGGASPHRPPKPPPPPRAHSLLPGNKTLNPDGTFKFPVINSASINIVEVPVASTKPQAPKRQCKSSPQRIECGIYDNNIGLVSEEDESLCKKEVIEEEEDDDDLSKESSVHETVIDIRTDSPESSCSKTMEEMSISESPNPIPEQEENQKTTIEVKPEPETINVTVKTNVVDSNKKVAKSILTCNRRTPVTKAPARPPPIYMKPQINSIVKNPNPWKSLEDSYLVLTVSNRELLVKLVNQALKRRKNFLSKLQAVKFKWSDFDIDGAEPSSVFAFGEKIAYHATMPQHPEYLLTLVVSVQQDNRLTENHEFKYPVFGQFLDCIPRELLETSSDAELESMQAMVLILNRSNISTIECFSENLPNPLTIENEKELCFILLQLIQSLKSIQAQGIESIEPSFQNLILAKSKHDKYSMLIFLHDNCYDENDYESDSCKISLCQYALLLVFQILGMQTIEECTAEKFSSEASKSVFEYAINLFMEEKAVSLSQTKTLFECFLWDVTRVVESLQESDDVDNALHRWFDIKRVNFVKDIIDEDVCDMNVLSEYYSQFLLRTSVRNIKEVLSCL